MFLPIQNTSTPGKNAFLPSSDQARQHQGENWLSFQRIHLLFGYIHIPRSRYW